MEVINLLKTEETAEDKEHKGFKVAKKFIPWLLSPKTSFFKIVAVIFFVIYLPVYITVQVIAYVKNISPDPWTALWRLGVAGAFVLLLLSAFREFYPKQILKFYKNKELKVADKTDEHSVVVKLVFRLFGITFDILGLYLASLVIDINISKGNFGIDFHKERILLLFAAGFLFVFGTIMSGAFKKSKNKKQLEE